MMNENAMKTPKELWVFLRRLKNVVLVSFIVSTVVSIGLMLVTASKHSAGTVNETVSTAIGPLVFFESTKVSQPTGTEVSLHMGAGILIIFVALPILLGVIVLAWTAVMKKRQQEN